MQIGWFYGLALKDCSMIWCGMTAAPTSDTIFSPFITIKNQNETPMIFSVQVRLGKEVLCTPNSTRLGFELMTVHFMSLRRKQSWIITLFPIRYTWAPAMEIGWSHGLAPKDYRMIWCSLTAALTSGTSFRHSMRSTAGLRHFAQRGLTMKSTIWSLLEGSRTARYVA